MPNTWILVTSLISFVCLPVFADPSTSSKPIEKISSSVQAGLLSNENLASKIQQSKKIAQNDVSNVTLNSLPKIQKNYRAKTQQKPGRIWNLRQADIRSVIAEVSKETGRNFVIDPRVQGKISIISTTSMSPREVYQVFLAMLQVSGYAAISAGDVTKIVPNIDAKTQGSDLLNRLRNPPKGDEMVVEVVPIKYVPSEQLVPVLRPLMPQWSSVSAYGPSNMLILSGRASNIRRLSDIIKQVDSSSANGIDIVQLNNALAMDVVSTLTALLKAQQGGPSSSRAKATVAADDRSNSILIGGSKTDRIRLRLLIQKLDTQSPSGTTGNTQVVYLHYMRAEDLVPILAGIAQANFSGTVGVTIGTTTRPELDSTNPMANSANASNSSGSNSNPYSSQSSGNIMGNSTGSGSNSAAPNTQASSTQTEGDNKPQVQLIAEPNTNSVIINAPPMLIRTLKSVISQLDIKPAQLLVEALVAEINENDVNDLGIEWGSNSQTGDPLKFKQGFAIINSKTSISDFQAQIYALVKQNRANILSTPSVVVLDNRQAKILVGKQVSIQSTSQLSNVNGTPYSTFDRVNVALHLYVRPQITRGQGIQLQIDQGNDSLDPPNTTVVGENPTFLVSSIVTSVHVDSGDIVVLGGLIQNTAGNQDSKIPILGDIPGLGRLFQHNVNLREKKVLMVFIRPIILNTEKESLQVTGGKYNELRQYQLDWMRKKEYSPRNKELILKPLSRAEIPRPFSQPLPPPTAMTK